MTKPTKAKNTRSPTKPSSSKSLASRVVRTTPGLLSGTQGQGKISILPNNANGYFFEIDGIAAEFWTSIDGYSPVSEIIGQLSLKHHVPQAKLMRHVKSFLTQLKKEGLIQE